MGCIMLCYSRLYEIIHKTAFCHCLKETSNPFLFATLQTKKNIFTIKLLFFFLKKEILHKYSDYKKTKQKTKVMVVTSYLHFDWAVEFQCLVVCRWCEADALPEDLN